MRCAVSKCEAPAVVEITFTTDDVYCYCSDHGWPFKEGWVNRGHDTTMNKRRRYLPSSDRTRNR